MSPGFPKFDVTQCDVVYSELLGYSGFPYATTHQVAYLVNVLLGEFRLRVQLALHPPLCRLVRHVVCLRANEEVIWVDALPVVTRVADKHSVGYRASVDLLRNTMGQNGASLYREYSVPVDADPSGPDVTTALAVLVYELLEPFYQLGVEVGHSVSLLSADPSGS